MTVNMDSLNRAIDRWNVGDLDGYLDLYDDNIRLHGYAPQPMDKAAATAFYRHVCESLAESGKRNPRLEVLDAFGSGDKIACRFVMSGTHSADFMGVSKSGANYVLPGSRSYDSLMARWSSAGRVPICWG